MLSIVKVPDGGNPRSPSVSEIESKYAQNIQDLEGRLEEERLAIAKLEPKRSARRLKPASNVGSSQGAEWRRLAAQAQHRVYARQPWW